MSNYYLFEQSGGVQILRTESPQADWVKLDDEAVPFLFEVINQGFPVRVTQGRVEVEQSKSPSPWHSWDWGARQWADRRDVATAWAEVRAERDALLKSTDWTQLPDVPAETRNRWAAYRQALRDITDQPDPFNIVWPVAPG